MILKKRLKELLHHVILDKKRCDADQGIALGIGICSDITTQELFVNIIAHIVMHLTDDLIKAVLSKPWIHTGIDHGDKVAQGL